MLIVKEGQMFGKKRSDTEIRENMRRVTYRDAGIQRVKKSRIKNTRQ